MELKNAVTVCLISLFAATIVVLIARALDSQAAMQLQPQLQQIAEELQAIRKGGGIAAFSNGAGVSGAVNDGVVVYYAHGNTRCPTCRKIESQAHEAVTSGFDNEIKEGSISWEVVNYETPGGKRFVDDYGVQMPTVVLVRMKDGKAADWKRLDKVWGIVNDTAAFVEYVQTEIRAMREADKPAAPQLAPLQQASPEIPALDLPASDLPLPAAVSSEDDSRLPLPMPPSEKENSQAEADNDENK